MPSSLCVFRAKMRRVTVLFRVKALFAVVAIVLLAGAASVQAQIQSPNNQLNTLSPIGVPPHATLEGTNEQVDLATGNLTLYLPMLSLPQRGGWTLPLGYTYDSRLYSPVQETSPSTTVYTTDGQPFSVTSYQYLETFNQLTSVLTPTLPTIRSSIEYMGEAPTRDPNGMTAKSVDLFCVTNWSFTDWSGSIHGFSNVSSCNAGGDLTVPGRIQVTDSADGSFYRLDTTNPADIVVYAKNGTQYHFSGYKDPFANLPGGEYPSIQASQEEQFFTSRNMAMNDVNGNTVTVSTTFNNADPTQPATYTLVDTVGRTITMSLNGMTYFDSNAQSFSNQRTISIASATGPPMSAPITYERIQCNSTAGNPMYGPPPHVTSSAGLTSAQTTLYTVTLPPSDASQDTRKFTLLFDPAGHLLKITYPTGGYTRYDYTNELVSFDIAPQTSCNEADFFEVTHRYACTNASGSCTNEDTTTYAASNITSSGVDVFGPYNGTMTVTGPATPNDPNGIVTAHAFLTNGTQHTNALESDVTVTSNGTKLRTTHTDYTPGVTLTEMNLPTKITTTFNDVSPALQSYVSMAYADTYQLISTSGDVVVVPLDNVTEKDTYDFGSSPVSQTSQTWYPQGQFPSEPHILDRPNTTTTTDAVTGQTHTKAIVYDPVGNIQSITTSGSDVTSGSINYGPYTNGYPAWVSDALGNKTMFDYTNSWTAGYCASSANPGSALTKVTQPNGAITKYSYNACTGTIATMTDANGNITTNSYDVLGREIASSMPNGYSRSTIYSDSFPNTSATTETATPSPNIVSSITLDGAGRTVTTVHANTIVDTTYDALDRVTSVSNPHFSTPSETDGVTSYTWDALNRKLLQCQPDNGTSSSSCAAGSSYLQWLYNGNVTDRYDEGRVHWRDTTDSLGRLKQVMELGTTSAPLSLETDYNYDGSSNLKTVNQHGTLTETSRTRSFTYDSLSRLLSSTNPETGTIGYTYDLNGNILTRTDARNITTNYIYDALNRLTGKTYSDATPTVTYNYDEKSVSWGPSLANTIGRLSSAFVGGASPYSQYAYTYDAVGRISRRYYLDPNATGTGLQAGVGNSGYNYDLVGNVTFSNFGPYLNLTRDADGKVSDVTANKTTTFAVNGISSYTLFANATYTPFGAPYTRSLGNGMTETRHYDVRGRMISIAQSKTGSTVGYSASVEYEPNGNVIMSNDSVNGNWIYQYDSLNRLKGASSAAGLNLSWVYDSFGNRWSQSASGTGSAPQPSFTFTGNNNQTDPSNGLVYDAAGNVQVDNLDQGYLYDAEGRISSASLRTGGAATYKYDSDGNLIYENGGTGTQVFDRNFAGQPTFVHAPPGTSGPYYSNSAYIDGDLVGTWENQSFTWIGKDWLGTKRYETAGGGDITATTVPTYRNSYTNLPFGDALSSIGLAPEHFTGKERDAESGLDYFGARYFGSTMGRFMSPDPLGGHLENPQSLNKYAYALNNPLTNTDPTGLDSYLQCQTASSSCASQTVGYDSKGNAQTALVQGVTNADKSFTATLIGNANADGSGGLVDKTTGTGSYTASVNGSGVQFSNDGGKTSSTGVFDNGTPQTKFQDAGFANGGALSGFSFTLTNSKMEANQAEAGSFSFAGTPEQAGAALQRAGFESHWGTEGGNEYRSRGSFLTGANSGHFIVDPKSSVPAAGNMHFGEHDPFSPLGWAIHIPSEATK